MEVGRPREFNTDGFDYNGQTYLPYDPSQPRGTIRDYQTVKLSGQNTSLSIQETLQNVVKAQFKRIILPRHYKIISNDLHVHFRGRASVSGARKKMIFLGPKIFFI